MKYLKHPVFLTCVVAFILHQGLQKLFGVELPLVDGYLDSFVAMPVILTLLVVERQYLFKKGLAYRLPLLEVILATLFIAFIAEGIFPAVSQRFTGDWMDLIFYGLGSLLFYFTINRPQVQRSREG